MASPRAAITGPSNERARLSPPSVGRTMPASGSICSICSTLESAERELAEYRSSASTKPCPISNAPTDATSHVARARSAIPNSRCTRPPCQQCQEHVSKRQLRIARLGPELGKSTESQGPPFGEQQHALGHLLRIGELMDAGNDDGSRVRDAAKSQLDVLELQRIERT